eukprot:133655-Prymnesium_polylepis.1
MFGPRVRLRVRSTLAIELPPPVVGCAAPEYYALDMRRAASSKWETTFERLLPAGHSLTAGGPSDD